MTSQETFDIHLLDQFTVASAASGNDLDLINTLQNYKSTDKLCATAALNDMYRARWYLVEELIL